ncbi:LOW QUALITY PROTEIN: hypothetical protein ACHAW6_006780 [Cyclotella cf. meneghiniana]
MCRIVESIKSSVCYDGQWLSVLQGIVDIERVMGVYSVWPISCKEERQVLAKRSARKPIGYSESFETTINNHPVFVHCTKEEKYVTKFMSLFGCLNPVQHHQAFRKLSDVIIARWPYAEPNSCHNKSKQWVDDARRHSLID